MRAAILIAVLVATLGQAFAFGDFQATISGEAVIGSSGRWVYSYDVSNASESTLPLVSITIDVAPDAAPEQFSVPPDWEASLIPGPQDIIEVIPSGDSIGLLPGEFLEFSFESTIAPQLGLYVLAGFDLTSGEFGFLSGDVVAPLPEPSAVGFFLFVGAGLSIRDGITGKRGRCRDVLIR